MLIGNSPRLTHDFLVVDATISFPQGLIINWQGKPIGHVSMGDIHVVGDVGASIDTESQFQVADVAHLTEFTKVLLCFFKFI